MVFTSLRTWGTTLEDRFPLCKWVIFSRFQPLISRGCIYQHYFAIKNQPNAWICLDLVHGKRFQGPSSPKWCFFFMVMNPMVGMPPKNLSKKQTLVILHQLDACFLWKSLKQFPIDFCIKFDPPQTIWMPGCLLYFHRGLNSQDIPTNHLSLGTISSFRPNWFPWKAELQNG